MQYTLGFDTEFNPAIDVKYEKDGCAIVSEKKFALFLDGTTIDFLDTPTAKGFSIDNPKFPQERAAQVADIDLVRLRSSVD